LILAFFLSLKTILPLVLIDILIHCEILQEFIISGVSLADLVRASDFETKIFIHGSSLHNIQLFTAHVRFKGERQTSMQMVPRRSESQRLPQEAALVFRTYAI
jgi:hypothetical protein